MKILTKLKQAQLKYIFIFIVLCIILVFIFRPRNTKKTTLNPIKNIPIALENKFNLQNRKINRKKFFSFFFLF